MGVGETSCLPKIGPKSHRLVRTEQEQGENCSQITIFCVLAFPLTSDFSKDVVFQTKP